MKTVLAVFLAALVGFGAAWFSISRNQQATAAQSSSLEADLLAQKAYLEQALADARKRQGDTRVVTRTVNTTITNKLSAQEIIDKLARLNPDTSEDSRNRVLRQIVYHLQLLAEVGEPALPLIHAFLKENKDVDYSFDILNAAGERVSRAGPGSFNSRQIAPTDFLVPPSMRLGLFDVLDQIGGEQAEGILAELLDTTGRGVEVAYIARVLQELAPDKYRDNALKAAKELITNLPPIDQPNRLDENARAYLYDVLALYNDTSFSPVAQSLLVTADGRIDRNALNYLSTVFKDQSVPALFAAANNPKLTNQVERVTLLNAALNFAGPSSQANQLLADLVNNDAIPAGVRAYSIQTLAGGVGSHRPTDAPLIQARLQILKKIRDDVKDERILRSIDETRADLEKSLAAARGQ